MDWLRNLLIRLLGMAAPAVESDRTSDLLDDTQGEEGHFVLSEGGYRIRVPHLTDVGQSVGDMLPAVKEGLSLLPPLPVVVVELLREIQDPKSTASSVAEVASSDPSLAASLLRTSNSAAMGLSRTITSVSEAVSYLGFGTVKAMVIRLRLDQVLTPKNDVHALDADDLWVHSLAVSYAAECLARQIGGVDNGFVATLGLMHDIGKLAILSQFPEEATQLRATLTDTSKSWHEREAAAFGQDHAGIGANLAAKWKLPADLIQAIRWHHRPAAAFGPGDPLPLRKAVQIVQIANQLAKYCFPYADVMEIEQVSEEGFALLNLEPSLAKLLDKPIRDAMSKAIFFAEGNTRMPSAAPRRFLRPLRGEAAKTAAAGAGQPSVVEESALFTRLFSDEAPELYNNNGPKQALTGLKHAGFDWTLARLDIWLTDPQKMIAGATMPMTLPEAQARWDIIAYLRSARPGS